MTEKQIYLPAEWAEQEFVQLTWPHAQTDWAYMLDEVNNCFIAIAKEIAQREKLLIVTPEPDEIRKLLNDADLSKIHFVSMPTNDTWARDHGGITVFEDGRPVVCDFTFNGWGMKFAANFDNQITAQLFAQGVFEGYSYKNCLKFVLEGGSIESDGKGTLLTTAECLLSDNRNNLSREDVEILLKQYFGVDQVLWLNHGYLAGDDTDSHVDTLARLCPNDVITYVQCDDEADEHYDELKKMKKELVDFRTLDGKPFHLIPLPMADAVFVDGERLPATYANFLIMNKAVLVPVYDSPKDNMALQQLQKAFPDREVIGIDCNALIKQHGSLHCVTMQYPKLKN